MRLEDIRITIAANLVALRREKKFSQAELAEKFGYSDKAVSKWERGESLPDISILKQIADFYGVTVDYLLHDDHSSDKRRPKLNNTIVILLSFFLVWLIATSLFVSFNSANLLTGFDWLTFVYAVPVSLIVLLVMNSVMGKPRFNYLIISLLVWTTLLCLYLTFLNRNLWLLFMIGIPSQIIILLWMFVKKRQ